jgi:GTPase KRas protein
MLHRPNSVL